MGNDNCTNFCLPAKNDEILIAGLQGQPLVSARSNAVDSARPELLPDDGRGNPQQIFQSNSQTPLSSSKAVVITISDEPIIPEDIESMMRGYMIEHHFEGNELQKLAWVKLSDQVYFKGEPEQKNVEARLGLFVLLATNSFYIGQFNHAFKCQGQGMIIHSDRSYYKGGFLEGFAHGEGERKDDSAIIHGLWDDGYLITGKLTTADYSYEGAFYQSVPHGHGHLRRGPSYYYEGQFKNGLYHGVGIEGDQKFIYNGKWQEGVKQGRGMINYTDGSCYSGDWAANRKEGQGIFTTVRGRKWQGLWTAGAPHKGRWL